MIGEDTSYLFYELISNHTITSSILLKEAADLQDKEWFLLRIITFQQWKIAIQLQSHFNDLRLKTANQTTRVQRLAL